MFLASGPDLVVETCRSGLIGTFPALNQRTSEGYEAWLVEIAGRLRGEEHAPFGVNLIVHRTNARLEADLHVTVKHKVPLVITSLGAVREVWTPFIPMAGSSFTMSSAAAMRRRLWRRRGRTDRGLRGRRRACGGAQPVCPSYPKFARSFKGL